MYLLKKILTITFNIAFACVNFKFNFYLDSPKINFKIKFLRFRAEALET